ncbi:MAG TPA: sigma 54-interacting transcriptional regulator [Polyangiaceae bacterium]|nr:sigma 54-interacting transcriptional regulator [Polyangiaceae bacterium]
MTEERRAKDPLPSTLSLRLDSSEESNRRYMLVLVSDSGLTRIHLDPNVAVRIGRRKDCDIVLDDPSASREHAVIHPGEPPSIEDLGSANGTYLQGERLTPRKPVLLAPGMVIDVASLTLIVRDSQTAATHIRETRAASASAPPTHGVVLRDPKMQELMRVASKAAKSPMPLLILGETGVGKEVLTERIHELSSRGERPLLRVNCATLADGVLNSELFGHERGAFTGAVGSKPGLFEAAHTGTLFLDEVGEMALETQARLLRVLETGEVMRVGGTQPRKVDVRVISATNRDLRRLAGEYRFRADLYYRLNGLTLHVPPLRERPLDILPLANFFAVRTATLMALPPPTFANDAEGALLRYPWPGNVRELKHVVERAVVLSPSSILDASALQFDGGVPSHPPSSDPSQAPHSTRGPESSRFHEGERASRSTRPATHSSRLRSSRKADALRAELQRAERDRVLEALQQGGTQADAARLLGISRRALLYRLDALGIPRPRKGRV